MKNTYLLVSLLLFFLAGNAIAETRYVSDMLEITMRSGKGTSYGITRMLRSGTAVQVLEADKAAGYTRVRTSSGKEGWVLSRFVMKGRAARDLLTTAEKDLAELELENSKMIASFSRALTEGLSAQQSDAQFNQTLSQTIDEIYRASIAG